MYYMGKMIIMISSKIKTTNSYLLMRIYRQNNSQGIHWVDHKETNN
jgi:hypothetical protein